MSLRDFIRKGDLVLAKPNEKVANVVKRMFEKNVGSVLVINDEGKLIGIFTERDLLRVVAQGESLDKPIGDYMTKSIIVANPDDPIPKVASIMIEKWIRHIPIVDKDGKPIGIVSIRDVLRYLVSESTFP